MASYRDSTGVVTVEVDVSVVDKDRDLLRVSIGTPWHGAFADVPTDVLKSLIAQAWEEVS